MGGLDLPDRYNVGADLLDRNLPKRAGKVAIHSAAGDLTYDLMVVLEGEVEISDVHAGRRRALFTFGPRDFIAELNLLTGQRVYVTVVVTEAGSIIRVP